MRATSFYKDPASKYWCGNKWRFPYPGRTLNPKEDTIGRCLGKAKVGGAEIPAVEQVEVRGWIRDPDCDPLTCLSDDEGEMKFALEPDIDWEPSPKSPPGLTALNTFEKVARVFTPLKDGVSGKFHVEINFWVPSRVCEFPTGPGSWFEQATNYNKHTSHCAAFGEQRPEGWTYPVPDQPYIFSPFDFQHPVHVRGTDDGPFKAGDYVRVVGTVWEDGAHDATDCVRAGSNSDRGWVELHPVDFIARIKPPTHSDGSAKTFNEVAFLLACARPSLIASNIDQRSISVPVAPKPPGHQKIVIDEFINPDWTRGAITPAKMPAKSSARVEVTVQSEAGANAAIGSFFGAYRTRWISCVPQCEGKCGGITDECDGTCHKPCPPAKCDGDGKKKWCHTVGRCIPKSDVCPTKNLSP